MEQPKGEANVTEIEKFRHLDSYYMDERSQAARDIYNKLKTGVAEIIKTTRVGATTSLSIESPNRKEKCLILTPRNDIIKNTIIKGINETCEDYGNEPPNTIHVPSNLECVHYLNKIGVFLIFSGSSPISKEQ